MRTARVIQEADGVRVVVDGGQAVDRGACRAALDDAAHNVGRVISPRAFGTGPQRIEGRALVPAGEITAASRRASDELRARGYAVEVQARNNGKDQE